MRDARLSLRLPAHHPERAVRCPVEQHAGESSDEHVERMRLRDEIAESNAEPENRGGNGEADQFGSGEWGVQLAGTRSDDDRRGRDEGGNDSDREHVLRIVATVGGE